MLKKKYLFLAALSIVSAVGSASLSEALPYNGANVYRIDNHTLMVSASPNTTVKVTFLGQRLLTYNRTADACGVINVPMPNPLPPSNYLVVNGVGKDMAAAAASPTTAPTCDRRTGQLREPRTTDFTVQTPQGLRYYAVGFTPGSTVPVELAGHLSVTRRANECSFVQLRSNSRFDLSAVGEFQIQINEGAVQNLNFGDLPNQQADFPPLCRSYDGSNTTYVPVNW